MKNSLIRKLQTLPQLKELTLVVMIVPVVQRVSPKEVVTRGLRVLKLLPQRQVLRGGVKFSIRS